MSDNLGDTQKRSTLAPWLIGCGLAIVLAIVGLGGAGYYWWTTSIFLEDADINAVAAEMIPGASSPEGLEPVWGMDTFGVKMAVFGPAGVTMGEDADETATMIVVASGERGNGDVIKTTMRDSASGESNKVSDVEEIGEEVIVVGGIDITFTKSRGKQDNGNVIFFVAEFPGKDGRQPMVMIMGPEDGFDRKAMDAFLAGIGPLEKADAEPVTETTETGESKVEPGAGKGKGKDDSPDRPDPSK